MKYIFFLAALCLPFSIQAKPKYDLETVVSVEDVIWGFDFLPDGRIILNERGGKLSTYDLKTKKITTVEGAPKVYAVGQGGLLDVRVHPTNGFIYLTYSEPVNEIFSNTALARAKFEGNKLTNFQKLFTSSKSSNKDYHYGSRIEFDGKGHVFITVGERGERGYIQNLDNTLGKVIRLNEDGSIPNDNPYVGQKNAKAEVWSRGLRSPQGLAMRPGTDELWEAEMGPKGGDEVNLIIPKGDYGWPFYTYGTEYDGPKIGRGTKHPQGVQEPIAYWVPSISPSAMTFYSGDKMPEWKGNLFLGLLSGQHIRRLTLTGKQITAQEELFKDKEWRFRNLRTGPDGYLWFSTDEGKLGRVVAK